MFYIAIIDDESIFREQIKEILQKYMDERGRAYEIDTFRSGKEFIEQGVEMVKYKIVFLDINMEELDGIMTAKKIRENSRDMFIVFITAFINYTLEGYKVDAVRYILKEDKGMDASIYECLDAIDEKMNYKSSKKQFNFKEGTRNIPLERILYIESNLHILKFYVMEESLKKYRLPGTLNKLEAELEGEDFLRVHQSYLVNMRFIKDISRYKVVFGIGKDEKMEVSIPRARYNDVEKRFISFKGVL